MLFHENKRRIKGLIHNNTKQTNINPVTFVTPYTFFDIKKIEKNLLILSLDLLLKTVTETGYRCVARRAPTPGQILAPSLVSSTAPIQPT